MWSPGFVQADPNALAESLGFVAFAGGDPALIVQAAQDSSGSVHGSGVWLPGGKTISRIADFVTVAGAGMAHGILGLFDSAFNLLAQSADTPAAWQTTGWVELPLVTPYTTPAAGIYYVADLLAGTTMPTTGNGGSFSPANARSQLPGGVWRFFNMAGPLTAFPAQLTPAISGLVRIFTLR